MIDYTGLNCPVCQQPFQKTDDIVVCPECGAPHHRECFAKIGRCALADKHGTPDDWAHQEHPRQATLTKECPRCHAMNEEDALFCKECGQSLHYYSKTNGNNPKTAQHTPPFDSHPFPGTPPPSSYPNTSNPFDPFGGVSPTEDFDGATALELGQAVQTNPRYYLPIFARLRTLGRGRFHFAAFFFGGAWYLFRKQYTLGILFLLGNLLLTAGSVLVQMLYFFPLLESMNPSLATNFSIYQVNQLIPKIMERGGLDVFLCLLPLILGAARLALRIFMGVKANRFYLNHCVRIVKNAKQDYTGFPSPEEKIRKKGGVNLLLIIALMTAYIILYVLMLYLP